MRGRYTATIVARSSFIVPAQVSLAAILVHPIRCRDIVVLLADSLLTIKPAVNI